MLTRRWRKFTGKASATQNVCHSKRWQNIWHSGSLSMPKRHDNTNIVPSTSCRQLQPPPNQRRQINARAKSTREGIVETTVYDHCHTKQEAISQPHPDYAGATSNRAILSLATSLHVPAMSNRGLARSIHTNVQAKSKRAPARSKRVLATLNNYPYRSRRLLQQAEPWFRLGATETVDNDSGYNPSGSQAGQRSKRTA